MNKQTNGNIDRKDKRTTRHTFKQEKATKRQRERKGRTDKRPYLSIDKKIRSLSRVTFKKFARKLGRVSKHARSCFLFTAAGKYSGHKPSATPFCDF